MANPQPSPAEAYPRVDYGPAADPSQLEAEHLAKVIPLRPDVVEFTDEALHYAPLETAFLQAQDGMRLRLLGSVVAINELREAQQKARANGEHVPRLPYSADAIEQNKQLAEATDARFWANYNELTAARHS